MSRRERMQSSESGVSLILVLVTLTIFGLLVPILGQFGAVNGVSAYIVKGQRYDRYAAANGMNAAIAWAQDGRTAGRERLDCPTPITTEITGPTAASSRLVTVKCTGFKNSGKPRGSDDSIPAYAVLALGGNSPGININNGGRLKSNGAWWSNTTAEVDEVTMDATADLFGASGGCSFPDGGELFAAPSRCDPGAPTVADPGYQSSVVDIGDVPVRNLDYDVLDGDSDAPCAAVPANRVLALEPGYYWDQRGLDRIGRGSCGPVVIWLQPGRFYFDFDFYDLSESNSRWRIGRDSSSGARVVLVGGEPNGWGPGDSVDTVWNAVSTQNSSETGGACNTDAAGVEMVFGSSARIEVESPGRIEICPLEVGGSSPHLAIVGRTTGATNLPVDRTASPVRATPAWRGFPPFTWPALLPDPSPLDAADCVDSPPCDPARFVEGQLSGRNRDASISMVVPNPVPAGDRLDQLELTIRHREPGDDDDRDRDSVIVEAVSPTPGVDCPETELRLDDRWQNDIVVCDLDPNLPPMPAMDELTFDFVLETGDRDPGPSSPLTFQVDQVHLKATSAEPSLRAPSGCVADGGCNLFYVDNDGAAGEASAFVWGTVYAPLARVRADVQGHTRFKFARGIVANSVQIDDLPNDEAFVLFGLPNGGIYTERSVSFEAFLGTNLTDPVLTARVKFPDPIADPGAPPEVTSWNPHK